MENKKQELTNVLKPYAIEYRPDGTTKEITEQEYLMSKDSYPRKGKQIEKKEYDNLRRVMQV